MKKAIKIVRYIAKYPHAKPDEVAKACGSTKSSVYTIRHRYKNEIAAKRLELQEESNDNVLDLRDYSIINEHFSEEQLKEVAYSVSQGRGKDRMVSSGSPSKVKDRMVSGTPKRLDGTEPETKPQSVDALVNERAEKYGKFENLAEVSQRFKDSLHYFLITRNKYLAPDQQEAMELIFHKFARIINGDADYIDNWKDIAGYATLVSDRLEGNAR
jgi:hypothetical protein